MATAKSLQRIISYQYAGERVSAFRHVFMIAVRNYCDGNKKRKEINKVFREWAHLTGQNQTTTKATALRVQQPTDRESRQLK